MAQTVPYFKDIRFDEFVFELSRGSDKRMLIPQLKVQGENLLIDASGVVAASRLSEVMDQPLELNLELGAKGQLTNYLQTLGLLADATGEDGFRRWNQEVNIGGTLGKPNTDGLMDMLRRAASRALSEPQSSESLQSGPKIVSPGDEVVESTQTQFSQPESSQPKSKEERVLKDIGTALDLFNSAFGK